MQSPNESLLLTRHETAAALKLSPRTIDALAARGELRSIRIGRAVRFSRADVEKFVADRAAPPVSTAPPPLRLAL